MSGFIRYSAVGAFATCVHYLVLIGAVEILVLAAPLAAGIGALCGAVISYVANRRFTFRGHWKHSEAIPRFLTTAAASASLSALVVSLGQDAGIHYLVSQVAATLASLLLGYLLNKRWTFAA